LKMSFQKRIVERYCRLQMNVKLNSPGRACPIDEH
jgi:hypothetical protein